MKTNKAIFLMLPVMVALAGCGPAGTEGDHHDDEAISVTTWTDKTELFMEYPAMVMGHETAFLAHLTTLADFKPVTEGKVTLSFKNGSGVAFQAVADSPVRDGIFTSNTAPAEAGKYDLELIVESPQVSDVIHVGEVTVYADEGMVPHVHEEAELGLISFLKEQQWKIDFRTEEARRHTLKRTVRAVGEIRPKLRYHARLVSPVEGIILADHDHPVPAPGSEVRRGEVLASICPPPNAEGSWTEQRLAYDRARSEYERAKRLFEVKAISEKRYQEAWREYEIRKSSYESFMGDMGGPEAMDVDDGHFALKAPISGIVAQVSFVPGQKVEAGQDMFTIIDPSKVWVSVKVPEKDAPLISETSGAYLEVVASGEALALDSGNSTLLSIGDIVDSETRTVEVIFEVHNPDRNLKIGQFVRAALHTEEEITGVALPGSAVYDEGGWHVVYVQREGESFEQRRVKTGVQYHDMVQITEGLSEGERVVIVGGYQVKLASLTAEVGHGHTH